MATVISDFSTDSSRFHHSHTMRAGSQSTSRSPVDSQSSYRTTSRPPPSPRPQPPSTADTPPLSSTSRTLPGEDSEDVTFTNTQPPSQPSSSSPNPVRSSRQRFSSQENFRSSPKPQLLPIDVQPKASNSSPSISNSAPLTRSTRSLGDVTKYGENTIKVRDLAHIQEFATEDFLSYRGASGRRRTADDPTLKYEISGMPITNIIEMVAGLLTKITTTNDRQHENLHRPIPSGDGLNMSGLSSSVLAFHGKNVPSITILSYLSRIHKYCPTTYEVFLSLLVYFDRMTERVNAAPIRALSKDSTMEDTSRPNSQPSSGYSAEGSDLADSPTSEKGQYTHESAGGEKLAAGEVAGFPLAHFFVVDSFNIHRLVIAGVTCASKFFSDVFYTNSRYAKVGGLPLAELNHLELQFLLLNDFRLSVPVEELEAYGTMLVEFYAREVIAQRQGVPGNMAYPEDAEMRTEE